MKAATMRRASATVQQGQRGRTLISRISNKTFTGCRTFFGYLFIILPIITFLCLGGNASSESNKAVFQGASAPQEGRSRSFSSISTLSSNLRPQEGGLRRRNYHEDRVDDKLPVHLSRTNFPEGSGGIPNTEKTTAASETKEEDDSTKASGRLRGDVPRKSEPTKLLDSVDDGRGNSQRGENTRDFDMPRERKGHPVVGPLSSITSRDYRTDTNASSSEMDIKTDHQLSGSFEDEVADPILTALADATLNFSHKNLDMKHGAVVLTDATFNKIVDSSPFLLVLFYAPWCHWSRAALPEFDAVAKLLAGAANTDALLAKVDCTENPKISRDQHILEYPVIKVFIDGEARQYEGGRRRSQILAWLNYHLSRDELLESVLHLTTFLQNSLDGALLVVAVDEQAKGLAAGQPSPQKTLPSELSEQSHRADHHSIVRLRNGAKREGGRYDQSSLENAEHSAAEKTIGSSSVKKEQYDRDVFLHVARSMSDDVLFGEIASHEVFSHFLETLILPHSERDREYWTPPFVVTLPAFPLDPRVVKFEGDGSDHKALRGFIRKFRFPPVVGFEPDQVQDFFDDGRPLCILLVPRERPLSTTGVQSSDIWLSAFEEVAKMFREDILFTVSGNREPQERRLMTLLGIDDNFDQPEIRIVVFSPSGNGKYFPNEKYKPDVPITDQDDHHISTRVKSEPEQHKSLEGSKKTVHSSQAVPARLAESRWSPVEESVYRMRSFARSSARKNSSSKQRFIANRMASFCRRFLNGDLHPYLNSEPIPTEDQNNGPVRIIVGANFKDEVIGAPYDVLVTFGAPWCGHCRKMEPDYKAVASIVTRHSTLVMAKIDATLNEIPGINLSGYPTVLLFRYGVKATPVPYEGDRSPADLIKFLCRHAQHSKLDEDMLLEELKRPLLNAGTPNADFSVLEEL